MLIDKYITEGGPCASEDVRWASLRGRPRLLDLFCGQGGAAMGYHRAGFDVVGVDIEPQPRYPFEFHQADALTFSLAGFDVVHASPPCQAFSSLNACNGFRHTLDLVSPIRDRLVASGVPFVIENVPGAPLRWGVLLCGAMFGLRVYRHRVFETSMLILSPPHLDHKVRCGPQNRARTVGWEQGLFVTVTGQAGRRVPSVAMGIDWMTGDGLSQAIPPAYTQWLGDRLLEVL